MNTDLIIVEQLPIIKEYLQKARCEIGEKVKYVTSLECNEETRKEIKKLRAELNSDFQDFESRRKEVKSKISEPYKQFELVYKENISEPFKDGLRQLDNRIATVENEIKSRKKAEVLTYFDEYQKSCGIDFLSFENSGIPVTLSASEKALKTAAKEYIDKIADDLKLIETQEYSDEILIEYKKSLSLSAAITTVCNRHRELDELAQSKAEQEKKADRYELAENMVDEVMTELAPPTVKSEPTDEQVGEIFELSFNV